MINSFIFKLFDINIIFLKYLAGFYNFLLHLTFLTFNYIYFKSLKISIFLSLSLVFFENFTDKNYFDISNSHLTILLFMLASLCCLCFLKYKKSIYIYLISFLLLLSFFNKINYAVYTYLAFTIIFILINFQTGTYDHDKKFLKNFSNNIFKKYSFKFQLSFGAFFLITILYLLINGMIFDWFIQTFINSIGVASSSRPLSQVFLELFPLPFLARHNPLYNYIYFLAAISYLPFLFYFSKSFIKYKKLDNDNFEIFVLSILALFLHLNYNPIIDIWHFYWSCPLLLFFIFLLIYRLNTYFNLGALKQSIIIYFIILIPAYSFLFYKTYTNKLFQDYISINEINFLKGIKVKNYEYKFFKEIDNYFKYDPRFLNNNFIVDLTRYPKSFFMAMYHDKITKKFYFDYKTISNNKFYYDNYESYLRDFIVSNHPIIITENGYLPNFINIQYEEVMFKNMDEYYEKKPGNNFNIFIPSK